MAADPTASALSDVRSVAIAILCAPQLRPERGALLRRTLKRACEQDLPAGVALTEVLVLDDGPHAHAAAHIAAALPNGAPRCVRLRHVSVPPDATAA